MGEYEMTEKALGGLISMSVLVCVLTSGCKMPEQTGFLSDYSRLEKVGSTRMSYVSPDLRDYEAFIVPPIQLRWQNDPSKLTEEEKAEIVRYFHDAMVKQLRDSNIQVVSDPGSKVARFRVAITDVEKSKWYLSLQPASKLSGAGTGGASMEAELVDSVTGKQLLAVIQAGRGNQFELDHFKPLDDVENVCDDWARQVADRLDEARSQAGQ